MAFLGGLRVLLDAKTSSFNSKITEASRNIGSFQSKTNRHMASISRGFSRFEASTNRVAKAVFSLKGALGAALGGASLTLLAKNSLDTASALQDVADKLGLTAEELQEFRFAAQLAGVKITTFDMAFQRFARRLAEFRDTGTGEASKALKELGVQIADSNGKALSAAKVFHNVAEALSQVEDPGTRLRLAFKLFDSEGVAVVNMLKDGAAGLDEFRNQARQLGVVINNETVRNAEALGDQLETLGLVIRNNFQAGLLESFVSESQDLKDLYTDPTFADGVHSIGEAFGNLIGLVGETIKVFQEAKISLAAFGIEVGAQMGAIDRQIADDALLDAARRLRGEKVPSAPGATAPTPKPPRQLVNLKEQEENAKKLEQALKKAKDEAKRIYEETLTPLEKYTAQETRLKELLDQKLISQETFNRALDKYQDEMDDAIKKGKELDDTTKEIGLTFTSAFEDAIANGEKLRDVLGSLAKDLQKLLIRKTVTEPLFDAIGGAIGGSEGGIGSLFSNIFGGARAGGGPVMAGKLYRVNEFGTEYFRPNTSGQVIPIGSGSNSGGGNTYNIDARGTDSSVVRRLEQTLFQLAGPGVTERRIKDAQTRGSL